MTEKQPKIVTYMGALYDKMSTDATEVNAQGAEPILVWQGRLIDTCVSVGIPKGYYKKVVDALRKIGSIEMITRGKRGSTLTAIALRFPPTLSMYEDAIVKSGWEGLTDTPSFDTLVAQVRDIQQRLGGLDWLEMFKNLDGRVKELEALQTATKASSQQTQQHERQQ